MTLPAVTYQQQKQYVCLLLPQDCDALSVRLNTPDLKTNTPRGTEVATVTFALLKKYLFFLSAQNQLAVIVGSLHL